MYFTQIIFTEIYWLILSYIELCYEHLAKRRIMFYLFVDNFVFFLYIFSVIFIMH